jgi:hypothetical protein
MVPRLGLVWLSGADKDPQLIWGLVAGRGF